MGIKNKIKIDSFEIHKMSKIDKNAVLKIALKAHLNHKVTSLQSPTIFFDKIGETIDANIKNSFVFKTTDGTVFGAVIIKEVTNVTAYVVTVYFDYDYALSLDILKAFHAELKKTKFNEFYTKVLKNRKNNEKYLKLMKMYGFAEIVEENDVFWKLRYKNT